MCTLNFCLKEGIPRKEGSPVLITNNNNEIDIILPCYNPPVGWQEIIHEKMRTINKAFPDKVFHLIVVNDGSDENMDDCEIETFKKIMPRAQVISYPENKGKGFAVRRGMECACSSMAIYCDWNFRYDVESFRSVFKKLEEGYDVVVAARANTFYNSFNLNILRSYVSILSRIINWIVLGMRFSDVQGGIKGMNRKGKDLFLKTKINQFLFDTEFVYMASRERDLYVCEVKARLRENINLSYIGLKVIGKEITNYFRIAQR
jgi:Glycosyltransferases involved in cell wall biogenesis